jgi:serine protease Do
MRHRIRQLLRSRRSVMATVTVLTVSLFLGGLVVASDLPKRQALDSTRTRDVVAPPRRPPSFVELASRLSPTVVNIKVTKVAKMAPSHWPQGPEGPFGEFFKHFFKEMPGPFKQQGAGSGVIISDDGYILTNNHVIEGADEVRVTLADKREFKAEIIGRDAKTDLAVLKVKTDVSLPVATLGDSDRLQVGEWVMAIGNPFGLSHTVTSGIVSAKGRVIGAGPYDDFIQTDASINPGNSGGPLFNMQGEVVGINTAIIPNGQGIGFAIPVNLAKSLIPQLVSAGKVTRGYLGVGIQELTPELAKALGLQDQKGALVAEVTPGSPAEKAGLKRGDVIVTFKGKAINEVHDLPALVAETPVGEKVTVVVLRDGKTRQLPLTVGELAADASEAEKTAKPAQGKWGLHLQDLTPELAQQQDLESDQGVLVAEVQPDSPAAEAGIRQGDLLMEVNRQAVKSVREVQEILAKAKDQNTLLVLVKRGKGSLFIAMAK